LEDHEPVFWREFIHWIIGRIVSSCRGERRIIDDIAEESRESTASLKISIWDPK